MDFRTTILPHRDRLYRLALGITMHTGEAEDVVQETMIRAWERRAEWPMIKNMGGWLALICRNLALDSRKRQAHTAFSLIEAPTDDTGRIEARDTLAYIKRLSAALPPPQDEIFRLRDIEGLSYRDIALQLAISEDQVRVYLHRARAKIREQIVNKT
jgi:RNA polymerase sigma-70 factor (ECF subfamily)